MCAPPEAREPDHPPNQRNLPEFPLGRPASLASAPQTHTNAMEAEYTPTPSWPRAEGEPGL